MLCGAFTFLYFILDCAGQQVKIKFWPCLNYQLDMLYNSRPDLTNLKRLKARIDQKQLYFTITSEMITYLLRLVRYNITHKCTCV